MPKDREVRNRPDVVATVRTVATDVRARTFATSALATGWDLVYALYLLVSSRFVDSVRIRMTSEYYFVLVGVSACILAGFIASSKARDERGRNRAELVAALVGGVMLLGVNSVVALLMKRTTSGWRAQPYADSSFYLMVVYALGMLALTANGWRRYRKDPSPVISLAKGLSLCKALMTLYFLFVAAVQRYDVERPGFLHMMLSIGMGNVGKAAAVLSFAVSVLTLVRCTRGLWAQRAPKKLGR